jgi:Secretion system C-terminal sorting domain
MRVLFTYLILIFSSLSVCSQATIPVYRSTWSGSEPTGWVKSGTGTYTTDCTGSNGASSCALNDSGDFIYVQFSSAPGTLTYNIKSESLSGNYTFTVESSVTGSSWTTIELYNSTNQIPTTCTSESYSLSSNIRYIRWTYNTKATGNVRLDEVNIAAPLPIKIKSFDVKTINNSSSLKLVTASETNNDYFTIERSGDGRSFDGIGEIKGAGNSTEEKHYEFTDENPLPGINYYRIKQTDFDGQYSYSEIRSVRHAGKENVAISPRNTDGRLDITTEMESYDVAVYSSAGQEVARFAALAGHQTVNIEALQAGVYFVKVMSGTESETVRVVKY